MFINTFSRCSVELCLTVLVLLGIVGLRPLYGYVLVFLGIAGIRPLYGYLAGLVMNEVGVLL